MDGGYGHGGGGGGSHGGSGYSVGCPLGAIVTFVVLGLASEYLWKFAVWLGKYVYETRTPVNIEQAHGDWYKLFLSIGFAILLGAVGILLLGCALIKRPRRKLAAAGYILILMAAICWLALAPRFEMRVIEQSPTNPSKLRPPASMRKMVPKRATLTCDDLCQGENVSKASTVRLVVPEVSSSLYDQLCSDGYSDEWASNNRPIMYSTEKTIDQVYHRCSEYGNDYGKVSILVNVPERLGPWPVTWRLRDPTGKVVLSSSYRLVVKDVS
jgi:hypothetical protein